MELYSRNYLNGLTEEEQIEYDAILIEEKEGFTGPGRKVMYHKYPLAVRHSLSLFPNHHLDIIDLKMNVDSNKLNSDFLDLLNQPTTGERKILNFINRTPAFHVIGSILRGCQFHFGHHNAYLFPEFQLGTSFKVDYLIIGKNSGGYEFVLVELESPRNTGVAKVTIEDGELGGVFQKGLRQVREWRRWLQENYTSIAENFEKQLKPGDVLPREFIRYDHTRFHYAVVAGMRSDFTCKTYTIAREHKDSEKIHLLHYENLYDFACQIIDEPTY